MNLEILKQRNKASVLGLINQKSSISKTDIARILEMTPAAISMISNPLIECGFLYETGAKEEKIGAGRKRELIAINYQWRFILSIVIESENTYVSVTDLRGNCIEVSVLKTEREIDAESFLSKVSESAKNTRTVACEILNITEDKVCACCVTVPGLVNKKDGISTKAFGIWEKPVKIRNLLENDLGLPVFVENNVNALALAELYFGHGKDFNSFLFIKWGPGLGSSFIQNRTLYESLSGNPCELGHLVVDYNGQLCACGRKGCLETIVSYPALNAIHPFQMDSVEEINSVPLHIYREPLSLFARTIINATNFLRPDAVILSGPLFASEKRCGEFIDYCNKYNGSDENGNINFHHSVFSPQKEKYIGAAGAFFNNFIYQI